MPKTKTTAPAPDRHKGQRSFDEPLYLVRPYYNWSTPHFLEAPMWRAAVMAQPVCLLSRETLIGNILSLDWKIEPRDSNQRDEMKEEIDYYTKFLTYTGDYDYSTVTEWVCQDYLDLPFGAGVEVGHQGDSPEGRVLWLELLDGGTLFPTLNTDWPIGQFVRGTGKDPIYFPKHAVNRVYMTPRNEFERKGWGMAPPEKIYTALRMISQGDLYYGRLLLDTPEAGILDLIDMDKDSAYAWVDAWQKLLAGVDPYKIPVLYEHTQKAAWIPFTKSPTDIAFNTSIDRYTSICCNGYGITMGDIGMGGSANGGNTLAGTIRDDRKTKRNGFGRLKIKMIEFYNKLLPPTLRFKFIDLDDEMSVALGRARLANATAWTAMVNAGMFSAQEARMQTIADGLTSISISEELPKEAKQKADQNLNGGGFFGQPNGNKNPNDKTAERPTMLGRPVSPSSGGWGETAAKSETFDQWISTLNNIKDDNLQRVIYMAYPGVYAQTKGAIDALEDSNLIYEWAARSNEDLWTGEGENGLPEHTLVRSVLDYVGSSIPQLPLDANVVAMEIGTVERQIWGEYRSEVVRRSFIEGLDTPTLSETITVGDDVPKLVTNIATRTVQDVIGKAVIAGIRNYIIDGGDEDMILATYDPHMLAHVRYELSDALNGLASGFYDAISDIIVKDIERNLNSGAH